MVLLFLHGMALASWFVPLGKVLDAAGLDSIKPKAFAAFVQLSEQSNQRVSIRVARPEGRRSSESLVTFAKLPTPIAKGRSINKCPISDVG